MSQNQPNDASTNAMESLAGTFGKYYVPNQTIFKEGEPGEHIYFVVKGQVRITISYYLDHTESFRRPEEGPVRELCILSPGDVFGEMALLDNLPRSATATAVGNTQVIAFKQSELLDNVEAYPQLAVKLLRAVTLRMRRMDMEFKKQLGYPEYLKILNQAIEDITEK